MQTLVNKTPRELAREYYNGLIGTEQYRARRRQVIDQITGEDDEEITLVPPAPGSSSTDDREKAATTEPLVEDDRSPDAPDAAAGTVEQRSGAVARTDTRGFPILPVAAGGVAVVLLLGWLLFSGDGEEAPVAGHTPTVQSPAATARSSEDGARQLVASFLDADDWSTDAVAAFVLAWGEMSEADQAAARSAPWFRPLSDALRERILEQRALGDIGEAQAQSESEAMLLSFAEHLGLSQMLADLGGAVVAASDQDTTAASDATAEVIAQAEQPAAASVDAGVEPVESVSAVARQTEQVAEPVVTEAPPPETASTEQQIASRAQSVPAVDELQDKPPAVQQPAQQPEAKPVEVVEAPPPKKEAVAPVETEPAAPDTKSVQQASAPRAADTGDPCPASLATTRRPVCRDALAGGGKGPKMVVLPAGGFQMGSKREPSEQPVHRVEIGRPFAISAYEIAYADYSTFCNASGRSCPAGHWTGDNDPMVNVSWNDARDYVEWLSAATGVVYRLPTEAEWEYAARGGTRTDYPSREGDKLLPTDAVFNASRPVAVDGGAVNVNGFRLRHMVGNVREWVADAWLPNYQGAPANGAARTGNGTAARVVRGGSYSDDAYSLRSSAREWLPVDGRDKRTGFRVVREVQ